MASYSKSHQKYRIHLRNSDQFLHSRLNLNLIVSFISLQLTMMFFFPTKRSLKQPVFDVTQDTGQKQQIPDSKNSFLTEF